jgi:hypothetical protein
MLTVDGSRAYLWGGHQIIVLDVTDPTLPVRLGESQPLPGLVRQIEVAGSYAYVISNVHRGPLTSQRWLHVLSLAELDRPSEVGNLPLPGNGLYFRLAVAGQHAYVTTVYGLLIVDVAEPSRPVQVGFYTPWDEEPFTEGSGLAVVGKYAYVCDPNTGLHIVDVEDPKRPFGVGRTGGQCSDVTVVDSVAYMAVLQSDLAIADVSDPAAPRVLGLFHGPWIYQIIVKGRLAYLLTDRLDILDVTNPAGPRELSSWRSPAGSSDWFTLVGSYAYVGGRRPGFHIVDVAEPTAPREVGFFSV